MRKNLVLSCCLPVFLSLALSGAASAGSTTAFQAGSLIIPRDECWQRSAGSFAATSGKGLDDYCPNAATPGSGYVSIAAGYVTQLKAADNGIIRSYGLLWFLRRNGVQVAVAINSDKDNAPGCPVLASSPASEVVGKIDSRDFCVDGSGPGIDPVMLVDKANPGTNIDFLDSSSSQFIAYRGSPLIIPKSDAAKALQLIKKSTYESVADSCPSNCVETATPVGWGVADANRVVDFSYVDIHVAQVGFSAEVFDSSNTRPAVLAVSDADKSAILISFLLDAGLADWCTGLKTQTACGSCLYGEFKQRCTLSGRVCDKIPCQSGEGVCSGTTTCPPMSCAAVSSDPSVGCAELAGVFQPATYFPTCARHGEV